MCKCVSVRLLLRKHLSRTLSLPLLSSFVLSLSFSLARFPFFLSLSVYVYCAGGETRVSETYVQQRLGIGRGKLSVRRPATLPNTSRSRESSNPFAKMCNAAISAIPRETIARSLAPRITGTPDDRFHFTVSLQSRRPEYCPVKQRHRSSGRERASPFRNFPAEGTRQYYANNKWHCRSLARLNITTLEKSQRESRR